MNICKTKQSARLSFRDSGTFEDLWVFQSGQKTLFGKNKSLFPRGNDNSLPSLCWSTGRFQNETRTAPLASKAFSQHNLKKKNIAQLLHFPGESLDMRFKAMQANLILVLWTLKLNKPQETVAQFQSCCPQFQFRRKLWTGLCNPGINLSGFHSRLRKSYCVEVKP